MSNLNDAEITALYVSAANAPGIQDDVPNAPAVPGPPIPVFDVTLEMAAGGGLGTGVLARPRRDILRDEDIK